MQRLTDGIMASDKAYGKGAQAAMVNLKHGAQFGPMTNIGQYIYNAPYVKQNLIVKVMDAPRGFSDLEDETLWIENLKALLEIHPRLVDGLNSGIENEFAEQAVGGAGAVQHTPTNAKVTQSEPSFTWDEKYGRPIHRFFKGWSRQLIMDPETKFPAIISSGVEIQDLLPDYRAATVLFFEPDPTHTKVMEAWLITNMMPKADGETTGKRDLTSELETPEIQIQFTGLQSTGDAIVALAQKVLDGMNLTGLNSNLKPAFMTAISADVKAGSSGYAESMASAAKAAVRT